MIRLRIGFCLWAIQNYSKGKIVKPKAVLAYCREKGIRAFDLRYTDLVGEWRHVTFPVSSLNESVFEEGIGQEVVLAPRASEMPYGILLPDSEANYLDPFTEQPTLVLTASVQDVVQRQLSSLDSRYVVSQAIRYVQSTAIADEVHVRTALHFHDPNPVAWNSEAKQVVADIDDQFLLRCQIVNNAIDAGLNIDRHLKAPGGASAVVLKSASMLEACDDSMMLRYLIGNSLKNVAGCYSMKDCWSTTQWRFIRNGESVFADGTYHGISEIGLFAQGGLVKHAAALSGIYLLGLSDNLSVPFPFTDGPDVVNARPLSREVRDANSPRDMLIEVNAIPAVTNCYLAYAATLMAMVDGVLNRYLPGLVVSDTQVNNLADDLHVWKRDNAFRALEQDWEFLNRGDVFSEELIAWLRDRVRGEA